MKPEQRERERDESTCNCSRIKGIYPYKLLSIDLPDPACRE